jgi:hypothetical protein
VYLACAGKLGTNAVDAANTSRKKPSNTKRLIPAPFNEFYPKRSGPTIPSLHTILGLRE